MPSRLKLTLAELEDAHLWADAGGLATEKALRDWATENGFEVTD